MKFYCMGYAVSQKHP